MTSHGQSSSRDARHPRCALTEEELAGLSRERKGQYETNWPNSEVLCEYHAAMKGSRYVGGCLRTDPCAACAREAEASA